ncbi:hypothetical protein BD779DRAFT_1238186 [Infundibulicybe gibba]|nr:hypothetical protein BD779DRAFT_1238186 [Infundibulicybe gibba]
MIFFVFVSPCVLNPPSPASQWGYIPMRPLSQSLHCGFFCVFSDAGRLTLLRCVLFATAALVIGGAYRVICRGCNSAGLQPLPHMEPSSSAPAPASIFLPRIAPHLFPRAQKGAPHNARRKTPLRLKSPMAREARTQGQEWDRRWDEWKKTWDERTKVWEEVWKAWNEKTASEELETEGDWKAELWIRLVVRNCNNQKIMSVPTNSNSDIPTGTTYPHPES